VFEEMFGPHVEALPITVGKKKEKRFILNVLARADAALDEEACKGNHLALHAGEVPAAPIFGVGRAAHVETVVDGTVRKAVEKAKLSGWKFEAVKTA